jgi:hypothetical protein
MHSKSLSITKKYAKSLLKSEGLRTDPDAVEQVIEGWNDAVRDSDEVRRSRLPGLLNAQDRLSDLYAIGYVSYIYGHTEVRLSAEVGVIPLERESQSKYDQLRLFRSPNGR